MASFSRARDFLVRHTRLLDRALFAHYFLDGDKWVVLAALRAYQNPDGGFGHGLHPDLRGPESQPKSVEFAIYILVSINAMDDPMVTHICEYLRSITTPSGGVPRVLASANNYPHGPHWDVREAPGNEPACLEVTASIVSYLLKHGIEHPWIETAVEFCEREIQSFDVTTANETYTIRAILHFCAVTRGEEEQQWAHPPADEPLYWVYMPNDYWHHHMDLIAWYPFEEYKEGLVDGQKEDGGWDVALLPDLGDGARNDWRGYLTVEAMRGLRSFQEEEPTVIYIVE